MTRPKIRWGILSTAHIAGKLHRAIQTSANAEAVAVASRSHERAVEWARAHPVARAYGSYRELLEDREVEVVYIALPPAMHHEWTIKAAECGKHVLCEKPLAIDTRQAIEMAQACRQYQVQLMDGVMWVHHERTALMRADLDAGLIGRLRRFTAGFTFNWDEIPQDNIRLNAELGGGCLGDLGWYCVRGTLWALGDVPARVYGTARYYRDVDMNFSGMLWFRDERMASFDCGFDTATRKWFEVAGTAGSLVCDDFVLPPGEDGSRYWLHDAKAKAGERQVGPCVQERRMVEHMSEIAHSGCLEERWSHEALATQRVCDALRQSARRGQVIDVAD